MRNISLYAELSGYKSIERRETAEDLGVVQSIRTLDVYY